jgi:serine/threonine protein kinase
MITGRSPFHAETEFLVFQAINDHLDGTNSLTFPSSVTEQARDLIEKLLQKEPTARLGAGDIGSGNGYAELKQHPFFEGVQWCELVNQVPPFVPNPVDLPDPNDMKDGAFDDWILEGDATPLNPIELNVVTHTVPTRLSTTSRWNSLLNGTESEVFSSLIWKRKVIICSHYYLY